MPVHKRMIYKTRRQPSVKTKMHFHGFGTKMIPANIPVVRGRHHLEDQDDTEKVGRAISVTTQVQPLVFPAN